MSDADDVTGDVSGALPGGEVSGDDAVTTFAKMRAAVTYRAATAGETFDEEMRATVEVMGRRTAALYAAADPDAFEERARAADEVLTKAEANAKQAAILGMELEDLLEEVEEMGDHELDGGPDPRETLEALDQSELDALLERYEATVGDEARTSGNGRGA